MRGGPAIVLGLCLLLVGACKDHRQSTSAQESGVASAGTAVDATSTDPIASALPVAAAPDVGTHGDAVAPIPEKLACAVDEDCAVHCVDELGGCCPPCKCDSVGNRKWAEAEGARLRRARDERCKAHGACAHNCPEPTYRTLARCVAGRCVGEKVPLP